MEGLERYGGEGLVDSCRGEHRELVRGPSWELMRSYGCFELGERRERERGKYPCCSYAMCILAGSGAIMLRLKRLSRRRNGRPVL